MIQREQKNWSVSFAISVGSVVIKLTKAVVLQWFVIFHHHRDHKEAVKKIRFDQSEALLKGVLACSPGQGCPEGATQPWETCNKQIALSKRVLEKLFDAYFVLIVFTYALVTTKQPLKQFQHSHSGVQCMDTHNSQGISRRSMTWATIHLSLRERIILPQFWRKRLKPTESLFFPSLREHSDYLQHCLVAGEIDNQ